MDETNQPLVARQQQSLISKGTKTAVCAFAEMVFVFARMVRKWSACFSAGMRHVILLRVSLEVIFAVHGSARHQRKQLVTVILQG